MTIKLFRLHLILILCYSLAFCQQHWFKHNADIFQTKDYEKRLSAREAINIPRRLKPAFWTIPTFNFSNANVSEECNADMNLITPCLKEISQQLSQSNIFTADQCDEATKYTVMLMLDASAKFEPGILLGRRVFNGLYSECESIEQTIPKRQRKLQGGYGRLFFSFADGGSTDETFSIYNLTESNTWGYDVCLPRSCAHNNDLLALGRTVKVNGTSPARLAMTILDQGRKTDYKTWLTVTVLIMIGIASITGSIYDYFFSQQYEGKPFAEFKTVQIFAAFSIYTNISTIFSVENANKPGQIGPIHFMRFISFAWIVIGHCCSIFPLLMVNPLDVVILLKDWSTEILTNTFFAVDTFFFMSGLLVSFIWFKNYNRNKMLTMSTTSWVMFYVHRIIRLSPPYYMIIAFYTFVFLTFTKNMPNLLFPIPDSCEKDWWINFLYLNNYIDYKNQCYLVSWYLATDLQMYIFAPVILIPLAIKPIVGLITAALIFALSTAANMVTIYMLYFPPSDLTVGAMDPRMKDFSQYTLLIYNAPWIRCQIYIIGMLTGYLLQTRKELHINRLLNIVLWFISLAIGAAVVLCLKDWVNGKLLSLTERAFYSALSKVGWGLALSYITISCFYGYGGPLGQFMSWSIWIPLGRLTYSAYLIHYCIMYYYVGMSNVLFTFTNFSFSFVSIMLPIIVLSYFFAIFWSALIEIPTGKIEMLFLGNVRERGAKSSVQESSKTQVNSDNNLNLPNLPHLDPPAQVLPQQQQTEWDMNEPKQSLYKFFKKNIYKSYKPEDNTVPAVRRKQQNVQPVASSVSDATSKDMKRRANLENIRKCPPLNAEIHKVSKGQKGPVSTPELDGDWS